MKLRTLTLALLSSSFLAGCTYGSRTFESALSPEEAREASRTRVGDVRSYYAQDFEKEVAEYYAAGWELTGYSQFVAPLLPSLAEWNAKSGAEQNGSTVALLAPPVPANMNQHRYTFTFWRPASDKPRLFGGFYGDTRPELLGVGGCEINTVTLSVVAEGSPAKAAGLEAGDIIVGVNGTPIIAARQVDDLLVANAGKPVEIRYLRGDESRVATVNLGPAASNANDLRDNPYTYGYQLLESRVDGQLRQQLNRRDVLYMTGQYFGSPACASTLRAGDLIKSVDGEKIEDMGDFTDALADVRGGTAQVTVLRAGAEMTIPVDMSANVMAMPAKAARRELAEANLAIPPWTVADEKDYSWAAAASIMSATYIQYQQAEQARLAEYRQWQAQQASVPTGVYSAGGDYYTTDATGRTIKLDSASASMLQNNPGMTVTTGSRNGQGIAVYDSSGALAYRSSASSANNYIVTGPVPGNLQDVLSKQVQNALDRNDAMELGSIGNPYSAMFGQ